MAAAWVLVFGVDAMWQLALEAVGCQRLKCLTQVVPRRVAVHVALVIYGFAHVTCFKYPV